MGQKQSVNNKDVTDQKGQIQQIPEKNNEKVNQDVIKYLEDLINSPDSSGYNIFHRASLAHSQSFFEFVKNTCDGEVDSNLKYKWFSSVQKDVGVTPLAVAISQKRIGKETDKERDDFVQFLCQKLDCDPNSINSFTNWTPLHWAARYGDTVITEHILKFNSIKSSVFIPEKKGYFPIDLAGYFQHYDVVKILIDYSINRHKQLSQNSQHDQQVQPHNLGGNKYEKDVFAHSDKFLVSPLYASKLLYWTVLCSNQDYDQSQEKVKYILEEMESYPESILEVGFLQTPLHGVSLYGTVNTLDLMCEDYKKRHEENQKIKEQKQENPIKSKGCKGCSKTKISKLTDDFVFYRKKTKLQNLWYISVQFDEIIEQVDSLKYMKPKMDQFWSHLIQLHGEKLSFSIQDFQLNTPLHLAAMSNNYKCVKSLIEKWESNLDQRNLSGFMAKQMGAWFKDVQQAFLDRYQALDKIQIQDIENSQIFRIKQTNENLEESQHFSESSLILKRAFSDFKSDQIQPIQKIYQIRNDFPKVPPVAIRFRGSEQIQKKEINFIFQTLIQEKFIATMFKSVWKDEYIVTLDLSQDEYCKEAQNSDLLVKLQQFNLKVNFNDNLKEKLQPFSSKDKQVLLHQKFTRLFKIRDLQNKKVLIQFVNLHDQQGLYFLNKTFKEVGIKKYIPFYYKCRLSYFKFKDQRLEDRIAFESYFGEYLTLQRNAEVYYAENMVLPVICALAITIYQFANSVLDQNISELGSVPSDETGKNSSSQQYIWVIQQNKFCIIFAIGMSIWISIVLEFWKRRENTIIRQLGLNPLKNTETIINPEFSGYRTFSWSRFKLNRKSTTVLQNYGWLFFNFLFCIFLLALSVSMYFVVKEFVVDGFWCGISISAVTSITSFAQQYFTPILIQKSNIKYLHTRNILYINFIMIFRFINVNLPIFFVIIYPTTLKPEIYYSQMYQLILTLVGTKSISFLASTYGLRSLKFFSKKILYFYLVKSAAQKQISSYQKLKFQKQEVQVMKQKKGQEIFKNIIPEFLIEEDQEKLIKKKSCCSCPLKMPTTWMRMTLDQDRQNQNQNFVDSIEINTLMPLKSEIVRISDVVDKYIIFSLGILYAGLCPAATIIIFFFFLIDSVIDRYADCYVMQRTLPDDQKNLQLWNNFAEIICLLAVISNSYMLYGFSDIYEQFVQYISQNKDINVFQIVVLQEHIVLIILVFIKFIIPDVPKKLLKQSEKTQQEVVQIHNVDSVNQKVQDQLENLQNEVEKLQKENENLKKYKQSTVPKQPPKQGENGIIDMIHYFDGEKQIKQGKLSDFLNIDPRVHCYDQIVEQVESALKVNFEIRLYRETFYLIERAIMQRKFSKLSQMNKSIQISCVECSSAFATVFCSDCQDHYCQSCTKQIHQATPIYQKHSIVTIDLNPLNQVAPISKQQQQQTNKQIVWRKFEQFNFPLNAMNTELYRQTQLQFDHFKNVYINLNYIENDRLDIASVLVDQNYDSLQRNEGIELMKNHVKKFGKESILSQKEKLNQNNFNDEELFYLNRIVFRLFKKYGSQIRFDKFHSDLNTLQHGEFDLRLKLWLKLVNETEEQVGVERSQDINIKTDLISKAKLLFILKSSYPQDLNGIGNIEIIVDSIYLTESIMNIGLLQQKIIESNEMRKLICCIIQCPDSDVAKARDF